MGDWLVLMGLGPSAGRLVVSTLCLAPFAGARLGVLALGASSLLSYPYRTGNVILGWRCDRFGKCFGLWCGSSLNNTPPSDDVVPTAAKALLFRGRGGTSRLCRGRRAGCGSWAGGFGRCPPCKGSFRLFPFCTSAVVGSVVPPAAEAFKLFLGGRVAT